MPDKNKSSKFFYGNVITAAGFVVWITGWGTSPTFGVFLKPMITEFGWSRAEASLVYSLNVILQAIMAIGMGWLTDRLGPRKVMIFFGSFLGIGYLLMSQVNTMWHFVLFYSVIAAVGFATINAPIMSTISRWFVQKRATMIGIIQAGGSIGGLVLAPLVGWLILSYNWRIAYVVLGAIVLTGMVAAGFFFKRDPRDAGQLPDGTPQAAARQENSHKDLQDTGFSLKQALCTPQFWMIAGLYLALGFCRTTFLTHTPVHVQDLGFSLADGALVVAVMNGSTIIGRLGLGRATDSIGLRWAYSISFVACLLSLGWGLFTQSLWGLYLFALVFGFGWGSQSVLRFAISSKTFGLASIGVVFGALGIFESLAGSLGTYFAGYVFDTLGSYQLIFWIGMILSLAGLVLSLILTAKSPVFSER